MKCVSIPYLVVLVLSALLARPVVADEETARTEFRRGQKLFDDGDPDAAAVAFRGAYAASPNWRLYYNIGQSESAARDFGAALEAFQLYLALGGDEVAESRQAEVVSEIDRLVRLVGYIQVTAPTDAVIVVNDRIRGIAPLPGTLSVTAVVVQDLRVMLGEREILARPVKVNSGQTVVIDVADPKDAVEIGPKKADDGYTEPSVQPEPGLSTPGPLMSTGVVLSAVGGATLIGAVITGVIALRQSNDLDQKCPDGRCGEALHDDVDRMNRLATVSTVLYPAGGVLAAVGAVLLVVGRKRSTDRLTVHPILGPEMTGAALERRF